MAEGGNINRPPLFDGSNYAYWKARMRAFLIAIDERVWQTVEFGWIHPTHVVENVSVLKPRNMWTKDEINQSSYNGKGINALFNALTQTEFSRVSACETAKEIWDTLQVTHEGTSLVKVQKLQMLTSRFDSISMDENETFTEYYTRLQDIVNTCANLGEKISEPKVVRKILRTLPERFRAKVAAIETIKHPDEMKVEELVGALQTYEMTFPTNQSSSKSFSKVPGIALKSTKEEDDDSESDDDDASLANFEQQLALLAKKFRRKFRKNRTNQASSSNQKASSKGSKNSKSSKEKKHAKSSSDKDELEGEIRCYKCRGYGHISTDCPSKKSYNKKALQAKTWNDSTSGESSSSDEEKNNVAFTSHIETSHITCLSSIVSDSCPSSPVHGSTSDDGTSEGESEDDDLAGAYNQLLIDSKKIAKLNKKLRRKLLELESDIQRLTDESKALAEEREQILNNNNVLQKKLDQTEVTINAHMDKIRFLEQQHKDVHESNQALTKQVHVLKSDIQKFSSGSKKLDYMLGLGQTDKLGVGYERTYVEKDSNSATKVSTIQKVKTCHGCGKQGHIKRTCPRKEKKQQPASSKHLSTSSNIRQPSRIQKKHQKGRIVKVNHKEIPQQATPPRPNAKWRTMVDSKSKQEVAKFKRPTIRQVWIRKGDIFPCLKT